MEISTITQHYWTEQDYADLKDVQSVDDLYVIARRIMDRMPHPIVEVCGPIASGGLGSIDANLRVFNQTIKQLQDQGLSVFDQMPFEMTIKDLKKKLARPMDILDGMYKPLFESGDIETLYFIKGWESSFGSNWEFDLANKLNIPIVYLN